MSFAGHGRNQHFFSSLRNSLAASRKYANLDNIFKIRESPHILWAALSAVTPQHLSAAEGGAGRAEDWIKSFCGPRPAHGPYA